LAAEWAGFTTIGQVEWADYPTKVLEKHWPDVERWRDIRDVTKESFTKRTGLETVDLISGGFPCQPFSVAGKRKGKEDNRYLWPEMCRVIREIKPTWVLGENVPGILRIAGKTVCEDLEREGYAVTVFNFEAAAVGAKHRRDRVFFVAHSRHIGFCQHKICCEQQGRAEVIGTNENMSVWSAAKMPKTVADTESGKSGEQKTRDRREGISGGSEKVDDVADTDRNGTQRDKSEYGQGRGVEQGGTDVADTTGEGLEGKAGAELQGNCNRLAMCSGERRSAKSRLGGMVNGRTYWLDGYWRVEPDIPRVATGIKNRVDRLKCLGNAVVPQQVYLILQGIAEIERMG